MRSIIQKVEHASVKVDSQLTSKIGKGIILSFWRLLQGLKPTFENAVDMERAKALYEYLVEKCKQGNFAIGKGGFRESMLVDLVNG